MSKHAASARIAVLADTSLQRHVLQQALDANGYHVVLNDDPQTLDEQVVQSCQTDLWLIDLAELEDSLLVDVLLETSTVPVLFSGGDAPRQQSESYSRWERRLVGKLKHLIGDSSGAVGPELRALFEDTLQYPARLEAPLRLMSQPQDQPMEVWLLAASMGGPGAVKGFLDALPSGLPVAFIYAQHIDARFTTLLPQAVGRHSLWQVGSAQSGQRLRCGEVVVAPVAEELNFAEDGTLCLTGKPWPHPYSPSIEQMMPNLSQAFGAACGVIAFSGMGSDGRDAAAYLHRRGGQIRTQQTEGCICSSLPESLRDTGFCSLSGSPRELAQALVQHLAEQTSKLLEARA